MAKLTALGAYIFAGGFTAGVKKHFDVLAHFESGLYGTDSAKANWPKLPIYTDPNRWPAEEFTGKVDFVYSNPPCAAWSAAGGSSAAKWRTDDRVSCVHNSFGLIDRIRPKVWCWESVARAYTLGRPLVDDLTERALKMGYSVTHLLLEASQLGVAQRRNRFFMVVHNVGLNFPEPNFPKVTVRDALKGIEVDEYAEFSNEHAKPLLKKLKAYEHLADLYSEAHPDRVEEGRATGRPVKGRPSFQVIRLPWDDVSYTITGGAQLIHPEEDRHISISESKALCGYDQSFILTGRLSKKYAQVAQAVMPPVGAWLAEIVKKGIVAGKKDVGNVYHTDTRTRPVTRVTLGSNGKYNPQPLPPIPMAAKAMYNTPKAPKAPAIPYKPVDSKDVVPMIQEDKQQSGRYIRRLLQSRPDLHDQQIVDMVLYHFPHRKTSVKDVNWNRYQLRGGKS